MAINLCDPENLAGQVATTAWDCCHKVSENRTDNNLTTGFDHLGLGSSVTGYVDPATYAVPLVSSPKHEHIDFSGPSARCGECGWDLAYVANSETGPKTKAENAALGLLSRKVPTASFRNTNEFNPNSHLRSGQCLCSLVVAVHGSISLKADEKTFEAYIDIGSYKYFEAEIVKMLSKERVTYCKDCKIELRTCEVGRSPTLKSLLESATSCKIILHSGFVNPTGTEGLWDSVVDFWKSAYGFD